MVGLLPARWRNGRHIVLFLGLEGLDGIIDSRVSLVWCIMPFVWLGRAVFVRVAHERVYTGIHRHR